MLPMTNKWYCLTIKVKDSMQVNKHDRIIVKHKSKLRMFRRTFIQTNFKDRIVMHDNIIELKIIRNFLKN